MKGLVERIYRCIITTEHLSKYKLEGVVIFECFKKLLESGKPLSVEPSHKGMYDSEVEKKI
ncbi:hypothetical protein PPACK8108_LOCUS12316 [Phakopsora pachyrhizi]|uniref:Uncharacterized protein n=1 Tax=Phakopsora pachyrhizi TaxID=170000 RepID=A0AAV0B6K1_PHAPC|nr:hypothetical protein PPACK8108_LOCUS12316 [Phakopsora pachyrhizi]